MAIDQARPTLLVLRALGLGDLLTAVPALRALAGHFPRHRRLVAAPREFAELLALGTGVDELLPACGLRAPAWTGPAPDVAVNLHGRGPQSIDALRSLRPARLLSFAHPDRPRDGGPPWRSGEHEVRRWCRLLDWYGIQADPDDLDLWLPAAASPHPGAVVVHPGAAYAARRWPAQRYAAVVRRLTARGEQVVVTGTPAERGRARRVAADAGLLGSAVLAGRTSLTQLAALVAGARLVISNDTGVAHLATAYHVPSVVLFGPTPPHAWGPPSGRPWHAALWAGRIGDPHADVPDPGLLEIAADDVVDAARRVLALTPTAQSQGGSRP